MTTKSPVRKERKENADMRRRQILDATYRSIVKNGLSKTTLATVADEAGLSQGVAVFYFKSKNGLLSEALRDLYQIYHEHWQTALAEAGDDPAVLLAAIVRADFDPRICNAQTLSVWFAFWGEQKFTPQYADITREYDNKRTVAIQAICARLFPDEPERALNVAEWVDTLTDGYWQHLHLTRDSLDVPRAQAGAVRFLCAFLPDHAETIRKRFAPD